MIMRIPILKSILRNLDWFEEARQHHKAPEGTIFVGGINHRLKKEDWVEQKHPRADDGKFTSGSGGGSKKPSKTKRKLERRAEAASQGRVSGAIQTLLSGGSALDKIGWLNTSKPKEPEKKPEKAPEKAPEQKPESGDKPKTPLKPEQIRRAQWKVAGILHSIFIDSWGDKKLSSYEASVLDFLSDQRDNPKPLTDNQKRFFRKLALEGAKSNPQLAANYLSETVLQQIGLGSVPNAIQEKPTESKPEKPKAGEKPKPADKVESAKQEIANNIASGKLKKETVIAAVKTMYEQANVAEQRGDDKTAKELDLRAQIMIDGADIKGELYSAGILQMRGRPLMSIGRGMETRSGKPRNHINSLETAHRIENYRNKVVSRGEVLDEFREGEQNLSLYQYNGKTYLVDHDHPDQFSTISQDSWRRLKDELAGDDEPHAPPQHRPPTQSAPPTKSPQVTEAASSDILQHGKKIDEHGKASLHEYNGGLYMVTENKPTGLRISRPAWESIKYD